MQKGLIKVTDPVERLIHWGLAVSCLILIVTGMGMMFRSFNFIATILGGLKHLIYVHNFTGLAFTAALVFTILKWWKEAGVFAPEDVEWLKAAGGYLWHTDQVPETGRYNPGQKVFFITVSTCGVIMVITGLIMWFPLSFPVWLVRWMYPLHALWFITIMAFFIIHFYLGTGGSPGSSAAMFTGWVTKDWLRKQHGKWLKEIEKKNKLEILGGGKD